MRLNLARLVASSTENLAFPNPIRGARRQRPLKAHAWIAAFPLVLVFLLPFPVSAQTITSVSPASGVVGTNVTITGTGFGATQGSSTLNFNGVAATPTSWSGTSIVAPIPATATTGNVIVTIAGISSNGVSFSRPDNADDHVADAISDQLWNSIERDAVGCHRDHTGHVRVHPRLAGAIPAAGTATLSAIYTPQDTTDYSPVAATVSLVVNGTAPLINTVAGNGTAGFAGDGGAATSAELYGPQWRGIRHRRQHVHRRFV